MENAAYVFGAWGLTFGAVFAYVWVVERRVRRAARFLAAEPAGAAPDEPADEPMGEAGWR